MHDNPPKCGIVVTLNNYKKKIKRKGKLKEILKVFFLICPEKRRVKDVKNDN